MKYLFAPLALLALLCFFAFTPSPETPMLNKVTAKDKPLVILELFTSQGCSSCPPADALLQELNESGDNVIALSYHVDYWNYLGWKDPFSSPYYSARQTDYTERIGARTYTPQLIINGKAEMIGSRRAQVQSEVKKALGDPTTKQSVTLDASVDGRKITLNYELEGTTEGRRVSAVLAQQYAASAVKRGENRGRDLSHHNVVRELVHAPAAGRGQFTLTLPEGLSYEEAMVVLLVQDASTHRILGAGVVGR